MADIKFVHSNGLTNKEPDNDLGGSPSKFELAILPMNNLLDNVTPAEAEEGLTDYRCFYLVNTTPDKIIKDIEISLVSDDACSIIEIGTIARNEEQYILIKGEPEENGYMILEFEFGGPLITCTYTFSFTSYPAIIQTQIRDNIPYCEGVTVALDASGGDWARYLVTFPGTVKNRKILPIKLVQNSLNNVRGVEYRVANFNLADGFNGIGDSSVKVTETIADLPQIGTINVFNVDTGLYVPLGYTTYTGQVFALDDPLPCTLIRGDEVWATRGTQQTSMVKISKKTEGSPINQTAYIIPTDITEPDDVTFVGDGTTLSIGFLRPGEGFFVWVKRVTNASTEGCTGSFSLTITGTDVDYPE